MDPSDSDHEQQQPEPPIIIPNSPIAANHPAAPRREPEVRVCSVHDFALLTYSTLPLILRGSISTLLLQQIRRSKSGRNASLENIKTRTGTGTYTKTRMKVEIRRRRRLAPMVSLSMTKARRPSSLSVVLIRVYVVFCCLASSRSSAHHTETPRSVCLDSPPDLRLRPNVTTLTPVVMIIPSNFPRVM